MEITYPGKPLDGISPVGIELTFCEYNLGQYLTKYHREKSDVITWVEEEHEIMSDKGFLKHVQQMQRQKKNPLKQNRNCTTGMCDSCEGSNWFLALEKKDQR